MGSSNVPEGVTADQAQPDTADKTSLVGRVRRARAAMMADSPTEAVDRKDLPDDMPDLGAPAPARRRPPVMVKTQGGPGPLRASVQIREIDPWSALKLSAIVSVSLFFVWMIAVGTLYLVLEGMNVWERLNGAFIEIIDEGNPTGQIIGPSQIFGFAAGVGLINLILFTALCTLGSFIYNLSADLVGGVEVTLADRD